ncbi:hypothetical protein ABRP55_13860 [Pectobacterium zantedeschiae]|uniref:hypothetical protein n=1 Tax=Pectobacterium zantedeschiae TaxID=2034769 RepID=UPI0032F02DC8
MTDLLSKERLEYLRKMHAEVYSNSKSARVREVSQEQVALIDELLQRREAAEKPVVWEIAGQLFSSKEEALKPGYRGTPEPLYDEPPLTSDERERLAAYDRAAKEPVGYIHNFQPFSGAKGSIFIIENRHYGRGVFTAPPLPVVPQTLLRELVDVVWQEAKESTEVPSTKWADELIGKVFPSATTQDAVAWRWFDGRGYNSTTDKKQADELVKDGVEVEALGQLQAMPVVPHEIIRIIEAHAERLDGEGREAEGFSEDNRKRYAAAMLRGVAKECRAAMLQSGKGD